MLRSLCILSLVCACAFCIFWAMGKAGFWRFQISAYETADRANPPKAGVIVFTGSSSVRFWDALADDMKPLDVINRGFGGSQIEQVNEYASRIIIPYRPVPWFFMRVTTIFLGRGPRLPNRYRETLRNLWRSFTPTCPKPGFTTYRSSLRSAGGVTGRSSKKRMS